MKHYVEMREPERDPAIATALRQAYADAPLAPERAQALRSRIRAAAEALAPAPVTTGTAARELPGSRRSVIALWPRLRRPLWAVPALLAATIAAIVLVRSRERAPAVVSAPPAAQAVGFGSAEQALSADVSDAEFARMLTCQDDPAALLAIAVQPQAEVR